MLVIKDDDVTKAQLKETLVFAMQRGLLMEFMRQLNYLDTWGNDSTHGRKYDRTRVVLRSSSDLGAYSFNVTFEKLKPYDYSIPTETTQKDDWLGMMWGGLVYHESSKNWSVHT